MLEASYIVFHVPPFFRNIGKQLVKTPKLYFYDTGQLCYLLGIRSPDQLEVHPLREPIFESWVISEILKLKHHQHRGETPAMYFYRDRKGAEVDPILNRGHDYRPVLDCPIGLRDRRQDNITFPHIQD